MLFEGRRFEPVAWAAHPAWLNKDEILQLATGAENLRIVRTDVKTWATQLAWHLKEKSPIAQDDPIQGQRRIYSDSAVDWVAYIDSGKVEFIKKSKLFPRDSSLSRNTCKRAQL